MGTELFANDATTTVVTGGTTAPTSGTMETWTVASSVGWPGASSGAGTQFHIADPQQVSEKILVTNVSGTTWTVTRGAENTTPVAHVAGFTVRPVVTAGYLASVQNPMTTPGDIITGGAGGVLSRLGAGGNGQVLSIVSGVPAWANNPAGFSNPMTASADMIVGGTAGAATRFPVGGTTGDVLQVLNGALSWGAPIGTRIAGPSAGHTTVWQLADGSMLVLPLAYYSLTGDDGTWINAAINALPVYLSYPSGKIYFTNGTYTLASTLTNCPYIRFIGQGQGTIFKYTGNSQAVYPQNTRPSDTSTDYRVSGGFEDIVLDITGAGAAAYGIYLDSTQAYWLRCAVIGNPALSTAGTPAQQYGVWVANDTHSLNSLYGYCHIQDCGNALTFSTTGTGSAAQERIDCKWKIQIQDYQVGVAVINGMQVQGSDIRVHINNDQYAIAAFSFGAGAGGSPSNFLDCHFVTRVEPLGIGAGYWSSPTVVAAKFANTNCGWKDCTGILFVSPAMPSSASAGAVGKVVWGGVLSNDAGLSAAQTAPNGWL